MFNSPRQGPFPWIPMAGNANYTTVATSRADPQEVIPPAPVGGLDERQAEEAGPQYQVIEVYGANNELLGKLF